MEVLRGLLKLRRKKKQQSYKERTDESSPCFEEKRGYLNINAISGSLESKPKGFLPAWSARANCEKSHQKKAKPFIKVVVKWSTVFLLLLTLALFLFSKVIYFYYHSPLELSQTPYNSSKDHPFVQGCNNVDEYLNEQGYVKQNATFVMLARNQEIDDVIKTLENIEIKFNQWFQYPYVFLNDVPFEESFQQQVLKTVSVPKNMVQFGVLNLKTEWTFKDENTEKGQSKINVLLKDQEDRGLLYGGMASYHKMCRFYAGFFQDHELLKTFDYYWRIEPDVTFFCDLTYDPFFEMNKSGKKYGFTILISELYWTIPSLFRYTKSFINNYGLKDKKFKVGTLWDLFIKDYKVLNVDHNKTPLSDYEVLDKFINKESQLNNELSRYVEMKQYLANNKELSANAKFKNVVNKGVLETLRFAKKIPKIFDDKFYNEEYNLCHFWSNFEIASFEIFRSPIYREYFKFLDEKMGFTKERFGDAPVHTLGVAMLLDLEEVHYFRDISYSHSSITHCVKNDPITGDFENGIDSEFLIDKWSNYKHYPYTKSNTYKKKMISSFRKLLNANQKGNNGIDIGCNCECPIRHNEIENTSKVCSSKLFKIMKDDYTEKEKLDPQIVVNIIVDGYNQHVGSL